MSLQGFAEPHPWLPSVAPGAYTSQEPTTIAIRIAARMAFTLKGGVHAILNRLNRDKQVSFLPSPAQANSGAVVRRRDRPSVRVMSGAYQPLTTDHAFR